MLEIEVTLIAMTVHVYLCICNNRLTRAFWSTRVYLRHHLFQVKYKMCKVNLPKINILDLLSLLDRYQPSWFPEPVAVPVSITWALKYTDYNDMPLLITFWEMSLSTKLPHSSAKLNSPISMTKYLVHDWKLPLLIYTWVHYESKCHIEAIVALSLRLNKGLTLLIFYSSSVDPTQNLICFRVHWINPHWVNFHPCFQCATCLQFKIHKPKIPTIKKLTKKPINFHKRAFDFRTFWKLVSVSFSDSTLIISLRWSISFSSQVFFWFIFYITRIIKQNMKVTKWLLIKQMLNNSAVTIAKTLNNLELERGVHLCMYWYRAQAISSKFFKSYPFLNKWQD